MCILLVLGCWFGILGDLLCLRSVWSLRKQHSCRAFASLQARWSQRAKIPHKRRQERTVFLKLQVLLGITCPTVSIYPENINTHIQQSRNLFVQGISRDHFFSPGALIQAFYGGSPTSIKDLHGPPWFSLIWLWVFDSVRKSVVSIDSSHLFSFYGRNWRNTGCKVSFEAISCDSFRVVRTHSTLLCAPSKKPMLWSTTWWKKASKHEKRRWAVDLLPQLFELFFLDATQWIQNSTMILKLS
jgi:hypothetical protein